MRQLQAKLRQAETKIKKVKEDAKAAQAEAIKKAMLAAAKAAERKLQVRPQRKAGFLV